MGITEAERDVSEWMITAPEQRMGSFGVSTMCSGDKEGQEGRRLDGE